jgi:ribonuclease P protein component
VPKKKFKSAIKRNRIKRQLREAYRLNRMPFKNKLIQKERSCLMLVSYLSTEITDYSKIENSVKHIFNSIEID